MDIKDYLYAIRRRLWLPIALPLVAALVTAGFIYLQPERYQATATVVVPALSNHGYSTSAVTQYVSTFKDVLVSPQVVNPVSAQTGDKRSDLRAGLTANTVTASSNIILVTYTGPNRKTVQAVAQAAAIDALDVLLGPSLAAAEIEVGNSQKTLNDADQALADFATQSGSLFPDLDYKLKVEQLSQFQLNYAQATLAHDRNRIRGLLPIIKDRTDKLAKFAPIVIQYQNLKDMQSSAQAVNSKSQIDLNSAKAAIASDHDARAVTVNFNGHISRLPEILRYAGVAAGVALLLSLGYIVLMEFLQPAGTPLPAGSDWRSAIIPGWARPRGRVAAAVAAGRTKLGVGRDKPGPPPPLNGNGAAGR